METAPSSKHLESDITKDRVPHPIRDGGTFCVGIDVGSTSSDIVVLDRHDNIVYRDYRRTKGRPIETLQAQLLVLQKKFNPAFIHTAAATGAGGRLVAELLSIPFVNEVPAQARAVAHLYPQFDRASIIEMGGQDTKLIFLARQDGQIRVRDFALNTVCAAGTGSFLDQQAERLGINIEDEFGSLALQSTNVPRMAGRCSVFAKSDMIHLQQQATPNYDILAGLCLALASNLKSNLGSGREFVKPIVFTGGVAANIGVVRALEEVFELEKNQLVVPGEHFFTGAIGAILTAKAAAGHSVRINYDGLSGYLANRASILKRAPRREALDEPTLPPPVSKVYEHLLSGASEPIDTYLGVDVGSISTNVVVMDTEKRVLAKAYLMTAGQPLEAVREGMDIIGKKVRGKVNILGAATTGSGRYLTGDFIGADIVINEITAQAAGTAIVNPQVDTIFEIGGQDSKYISLNDGVVVDFEMNHACAAGTGSFLEEQAQRLDISINEEFANLAFQSKEPIKLGERCTVFMESDLLSFQQQGAKTPELVAGLSYSIVTNYLNRVVGRRRIGNNICFQGGTAFNKAVLSAFEKVTGKPVMVPDHHEVTGALGAASIAAEHMAKLTAEQGKQQKSGFRGFDNLVHIDYSVESFTCEHCPNNCEIKKVQLPGCEPLYYGSRCDRYNIKKKKGTSGSRQAFKYRNQAMIDCTALSQKSDAEQKAVTVGIPRALVFWQMLPMFGTFLNELGLDVIVSDESDKRIIRKGVESVTAQTCFPVKVAYGHVAELLDKQPDYIFIPSIVSMAASFPQNKHNQLCPYVQSIAYQIQSAFADKLGKTKIISIPMRFGEGDKLIKKSFIALGKKFGVTPYKAKAAMNKAMAAQRRFERQLKEKGREILGKTAPDKKLFVLVSRPYNGCDNGVNMQLPKKLAELGVDVIPMEMLDLDKAPLSDEQLHSEVYWSYGQKILRAAEVIKNDPRLFAIYLSNFSCGPDSFLLTFFKDIMGKKPCLQLELDEHSADAGLITRLEAFLESLKHYDAQKNADAKHTEKLKWRSSVNKGRTLYIPYMGDSAYAVAACFRSYGQPAQVMPLADEAALMKGRRYTTGKECLPCALTTGDMLKLIESEDPDKLAFFMPGGSGPCRFGMYNSMQRLILKYAGAKDIPIISPNQDYRFYKHFKQSVDGGAGASLMKDLWIAAAGVDLLHKLIMRVRPFAADKQQAQRTYQRSLKRYIEAVENGLSVKRKVALMASIAEDFSELRLDYTTQKPRIGVVGEIYVRSHPFANSNIIARLEQLGAACDLASLGEWIYYTNITRKRMAKRRGQFGNFFSNVAQDFFQHRLEKALAEPLEEKFGPLAEEPVEHVMELAGPYLHDSFEGEAVLSVGKMVEYHHHGFGGVVNVMPFSCMPSTIVSTQTQRISEDCGNMPILNISFDGQEDPALTTRLEAFVEQVRQRKISRLNVAIAAV